MKYKILTKYTEGMLETYSLVPYDNQDAEPKLYKKNSGRQVMVGREFQDQYNPDIFTYSNETADSIDMEVKTLIYDFSSNGYYHIEFIDKEGKTVRDAVHRIVCFAWNPNYDFVKHEVHHKDRNKLNNRADNLVPIRPLLNSAIEFKSGNPDARKYLIAAMSSEKKMSDYNDLLESCKEVVQFESNYIFNELVQNPSKELLAAMKYVLEKNGYKVEKD